MKKISGFVLMHIGKQPVHSYITKEVIEKAIENRTFNSAPIVFEDGSAYAGEEVVGVVIPNTVRFDGEKVVADVLITEKFKKRTQYDSWSFQTNKDKSEFFYCSCELFTENDVKEVD